MRSDAIACGPYWSSTLDVYDSNSSIRGEVGMNLESVAIRGWVLQTY